MKPNRLETSIENATHMPALAMRITLSVIIKKQSNFISSLLVSQKRLDKKVSKGQQYPNLGTVYDSLGDYKKESNFISSLLVSQKR